ncbi:hypothetical protein VB854_07860 [Limnoraphis robusta CCNP1315]|uniref:Transketolase n=2 Tax=Limnoraphis TaxID=1332112 RepID=A0ABU5TVC7_9CYAN|nr:hypothetical protein [Limnoraphis robusta]MEA5518861.1 hypothetical protein [Limnoraphis robusta CCNP1315]MEA5548380.1 hypothetical protein [Limnoraphis robusta CCNP1324]
MFHRVSPSKRLRKVVILGLIVFPAMTYFEPQLMVPSSAHEVEVSEDVAATFHLEPNHNPKAGETAQVWFALTRRGGAIIPLEQCNCKLAVYAQPRQAEDKPMITPPLTAISAEKYQGIPGANVIFPKAGSYELELSGTPKGNTSFKPFKLSYSVTVR